MMQGRAAGVVVTQSSAQPGGAASIKIRGTSSVNAGKTPLYVVDGFPIDNTNFIRVRAMCLMVLKETR